MPFDDNAHICVCRAALYNVYVSSDKKNVVNCGLSVWQLTLAWQRQDRILGVEFMDLASGVVYKCIGFSLTAWMQTSETCSHVSGFREVTLCCYVFMLHFRLCFFWDLLPLPPPPSPASPTLPPDFPVTADWSLWGSGLLWFGAQKP